MRHHITVIYDVTCTIIYKLIDVLKSSLNPLGTVSGIFRGKNDVPIPVSGYIRAFELPPQPRKRYIPRSETADDHSVIYLHNAYIHKY